MKLGAPAPKRVGLKPGLDWHKRNFLTEVLIPSLFTKRSGDRAKPLFPKVGPDEVGITWIGHASFLIQVAGMNVLIDPNWSMWLSVIKRLKRPGFHIDHLPSIDLVLVTHAHFDHLDRRSLRRVAADQPIVVPTGVGNLVHDLGFNIVHELEQWEQIETGPLKISMTPCHHWGARMLADQHRGFGGFVIEANERSIFHCGDSAYFPGFEEIGIAFPDRDRAPADRRLRRAEQARGAHEPGGSGARFSRAARAQTGADALRHFPARL